MMIFFTILSQLEEHSHTRDCLKDKETEMKAILTQYQIVFCADTKNYSLQSEPLSNMRLFTLGTGLT